MVELLVVNRLCAPRSELSVHEKWFPQTAMDLLLDTDARVAEKDRLYRCLDRMIAHKEALEQPLAARWRDLFGATFDVLLYDLPVYGPRHRSPERSQETRFGRITIWRMRVVSTLPTGLRGFEPRSDFFRDVTAWVAAQGWTGSLQKGLSCRPTLFPSRRLCA